MQPSMPRLDGACSQRWPTFLRCNEMPSCWVRTEMGGAGADITAEQSVAGMRGVIAALTAKDNGRFLNYDGSAIDW